MENPRFSVIIPTLNEEKYLPKLLWSLVSQTQNNFEVLVVDGRSRDKTIEAANEFKKKLPHLQIIVSEKASLPFQRNVGAQQARAPWLVFVDADTVLQPYFFERVDSYIARFHPMLLTTWFSPDNDSSGDVILTLLANMYIEGSIMFHKYLSPGPLTVMSKNVFAEVGGYNEQLTFGEDYDMTQRITKAGNPLHIIRETLYIFSLRRVRKEGKLKFINLYMKATLSVLFTNKNLERVPGYIMGGNFYKTKKSKRTSMKEQYEKTLKKFLNSIFG